MVFAENPRATGMEQRLWTLLNPDRPPFGNNAQYSLVTWKLTPARHERPRGTNAILQADFTQNE